MSEKTHVVSFRLDGKQVSQLDTVRGEKSVSTYCKDFILSHIDNPSTNVNIELLNLELKHKNELLESVNNQVRDLQNTNGFLITQIMELNKLNDRLLMPSQEEQKEKGKTWWQFWKK